MPKNCNPYDISSVISAELLAYTNEVKEEVAKIVEEASSELVDTLKQSSPKNKGKYAKSWSKKPLQGGGFRIYNKRYQLTHLLEYGHAKKGGGRTQASPHIKPAEEKAKQELIDKVERAVKG